MDEVNKKIWEIWHIHGKDTLPFSPWVENATRELLATTFKELGYTKGAEIGVRTGEYSEVLLKANPELSMLCVDPWAPYNRTSQERQNRYLRMCQKRLAPYKAEIIKATSMEAVKGVTDGSLDFVYIDGMHDFRHVMEDLINWNDKVRPGGMICGHDFYNFYQGGVIIAVEAFTRANNILQWYITRELTPSFFWAR